ncbi:MAG: methylmalonyl-CoA epimerase [candidate division WOR-3 bacterium]|nr:MAG: methylmalonyl-CoA epimerase [candidate division WOR-3 bacterium]
MSMKLEHIGIAVTSIERHLEVWRDIFGFVVGEMTEVTGQKVKVVMLDVGGVHVELIEPLGQDSPIHKFIEKRGEGLHHLSFEVKDLKEMIEELKKRGVRMIDDVPRSGAHGSVVTFVHPSSTGGVLIELSQEGAVEQEV